MKSRKKNKGIYIVLLLLIAVAAYVKYSGALYTEPAGEFGTIGDINVSEDFTDSDRDESSAIDEEGRPADDSDILSQIPTYEEVNRPAYAINDNKPYFTDAEYEKAKEGYVNLSELDILDRCGVCEASLGAEDFANEERGDISSVHPSGWHQERYPDLIEANEGVLYNRCHLIAYMFSGLNAEPKNLITGTEYMNTKGMLPYAEKAVQNWLIRKANGGRVLYRVEPVFSGNELVCRGVHIQAGDVETKGEKFHVNVFCYNVQPGVKIDYASGYSVRGKQS